MSNLANNTVTMEEILELVNTLPEGGGDPIAEYTNTYATEIAPYSWAYFPYKTIVSYTKLVTVGENAFRLYDQLLSLDLPAATSAGDLAFGTLSAMTNINAPVLQSIGEKAFLSCSALTRIVFPALTTIGARAFHMCSGLTVADLPVATSIGERAFGNCVNLSALILRGGTMCSAGERPLYLSKIQTGAGYIYVPAALVDSYKADANWSAYATKFRALESYTVDGTTTGALDETKI